MKKQIVALSIGLMTIGVFAQKKQLRAAEKSLKKNNYAAAMTNLQSVEGMLADMDEKYKAQYYFLKAQAFKGKNNLEEAGEAFNKLFAYEKEIGKERYTKEAKPMLTQIIQQVSQRGVALYNKDKDFKNAAKDFYLTYKLSPRDTSFLYNAAMSAAKAKEYDTSLEYFKKLQNLGYTGITTQYFAKNIETGKLEPFPNKNLREIAIRSKSHSEPKDKPTESRQGDIIKNIASIYINQGKTDEAMQAIQEARKADPKDLNLILNEAQLYIKLEKMDKFGELMKEAIELDPNNPTLFFNLGVATADQGLNEEAIKYYKKAIELKPDYGDAYLNLAYTISNKRVAVVEEMNNNLDKPKKYEELELKLKEISKEALPYLIKADSMKRTVDTVRTLINLYDTLEQFDKSDPLRAVLKKMQG